MFEAGSVQTWHLGLLVEAAEHDGGLGVRVHPELR